MATEKAPPAEVIMRAASGECEFVHEGDMTWHENKVKCSGDPKPVLVKNMTWMSLCSNAVEELRKYVSVEYWEEEA